MKNIYLSLILFFLMAGAHAQKKILPRGPLQQRYLIKAFITPQLKKSALKITRTQQIDSVFHAWETGWQQVSADSMASNPTRLTKDEFNNLDAYCYFWGLASLTQNLDVGDDYGSILVSKYMVPSMRRDLALIKRTSLPEMIEGVDLTNTIAIGSGTGADRQAFMDTYALYKDYYDVYRKLALNPDTLISKAAKKQLPFLEKMYYVMNARNSYYSAEPDKAFTYLVTGLNVDRYSKTRAIDLARKLTHDYAAAGDMDKAFALLNTLAINTTPDYLNRDTLQSWYTAVDAETGAKMYANLKSKLSVSSFKLAGAPIKLPENWTFVANAIPADKLKKAKYILVDLWYTGCGPCLAEIPELNAFYDKIKLREDVIFISINTDYENGKLAPSYVLKRSKELGIRYPVFYDSQATTLSKQLAVTAYPAKVILGVNGQRLAKTDQSNISVSSFEEFLKENK